MARLEKFLESQRPVIAFGYVFLPALALLLIAARLSEFLASHLI